MVSVYCVAYNHAKYIRDALEGFVNQVTDFEYEVYVYDDASADGTTEIIAEYAKKYPQVIKPIFQEENQYSKGVSVSRTYIFPQLKGKYIAVCEGDDYWCDRYKLKRQVEYMEQHNDCSACVHNTKFINCRTKRSFVRYQRKRDTDISLDAVMERGGAEFHTSSLLFRREYLYLPPAFYMKKIGDYPTAIYLAMNGRIHYFKDVMSVYRQYASGSWSSKMYLSDNRNENVIKMDYEIINMLTRVDQYSNYAYHAKIIEVIRKKEFEIEGLKGNLKTQMKEYEDVFRKLSLGGKLKTLIKHFFPILIKIRDRI